MSFFNISGFHSPPSRPLIIPSPNSPFCTSPSQLQEVTLDQDNTLSNSMGLRSPGGPMRGRSVKEFEEQLASLKKENFNLKLRIYFLEERMGVNFNLDKENIIKKNVELLVEVEGLRKEVQEKHDLLCQAVKAMELEDEENKKLLAEKDETISECQQEIECLKSQLIDIKAETEILSTKSFHSGPTEFYSMQTIGSEGLNSVKDLQGKIRSLEEELSEEKESNAAIQIILDQNDSKIKQLMSQLEDTHKQFANLEEDRKDMNFQLNEVKNKYQGLSRKLQEKTNLTEVLSSEIEELHKTVSLLTNDLEKERKRFDKLKLSSEHKINDLQTKLEASLAELKKSQELVVSKSPGRRSGNTDADSFLVQKPAASPGSPQKDPFLFPTVPSPIITPTTSPAPSVNFEESGVDLKQIIEQLKNDRDAQHQKIVKLKAEQMKACKIIKSMIDARNKTNEEITNLKQKNEDLERELEGVVTRSKAEGDKGSNGSSTSTTSHENSMDEQSGELLEHYKALTDELDEKNRVLMATLKEKDKYMKALQDQCEDLLASIKEKETHIVDLEFELLSLSDERKEKGNETCSEQRIEIYVKQLQEKDEEIERLTLKLLKKNCDLQGLVNNELWEKNRTIEKLQKQTSKILEDKEQEVKKLHNDLKLKDGQLILIKEKITELGFAIDFDSGDVNFENSMQTELENSEKLRLEANEMCAVLSTRLEELAIFLDSLLKQKSVLGFLGSKENKRLRQFINQSLDLSRSFTMSMIINPEQSLLQLTNISTILNDTETKEEDENEDSASRLSLVPSDVSLTYRSHLCKKNEEDHSQIIQALRQEIVNLKYELRLRDVEMNKINVGANLTEVSSDKDEENDVVKSTLNTTSTTLKYKSDNQSESEGWSEPDRSVSRARIGLLDSSFKSNLSKRTVPITSTDSTEEEELDRSSRVSSKKSVLNESRSTILELHKQNVELEQKVSEKEIAFYEVSKMNNKLKQEMANLKTKLSNTEVLLQEAESRKNEAEHKAGQLQEEKEELLESMTKKDKELEEKINQLEREKLQALDEAKNAEETAEIAKNDMEAATSKLLEIQQQMNDLEDNLRSEYENQLAEKLHMVDEESLQQINRIQSDAEREIKTLHNTIQQIHAEYSENYVKKCHVEQAVEQIERLRSEIEAFEERIDRLKTEKEHALDKLTEYEDRVNSLRSDLDNATLQYSEAVLEKTKIANEKALIEQELNKNVVKDIDARRRVDQIENELYELRQNHQKQVSALQSQKAKLEMRVSELESSNAELHNRLVKIQTGCGDHTNSLPSTPNFVNQILSFRRQHSENAGYLSEDPMTLDDLRAISGRNLSRLLPNQNFDVERNEANSSPDLGIESDHGRFSSLETHLNIQRPLLQTLELTESMNNLLDVDGNGVQAVNCDNAHCCQKTLEMAHENSDLKRKLLRTRRALEETVTQLTLANQRKKQVEKTICRQIHKTSQVLRKAKANLDSGSETDVYKK